MKKTLAILLALVLCFGVCALVACDKTPEDNTDVPVAEGKVTIYFTLAEDSVAIPSYASVYYAGGLTNWNDDPENPAPAMTNLAGTNIYYVQLAYDASIAQANEYSLVIGYNKSSGLPDDKCGLVWNDAYKSDTCKEFPFGSNASFEYKEGAQKISLGTHKFSTAIAEPVSVNTELRITFSQPLGENAEVYFMGGFNGWDMTKAKATANAARDVYSLALTDILCSNYDYKILVVRDKTKAITTKTEGETTTELGIWDWNEKDAVLPDGVGDEESVVRAYIEIGQGDGNLTMSVLESDGGSYIDLLGTISEDNANRDEVKTGLNLNQIDLVEGKDNDTPNNVFTWKYQAELPQKTLVVKFAEALPEKAELYMFGSINGWNAAFTDNKAKMTIAEDRKSASITLDVIPGSYEANIVAVHADYKVASAQAVYDNGVKINTADNGSLANGNYPIVVEGYNDETIELFKEAQPVPTLNYVPTVSVTFKVTFSESLTGKAVYMAGTINEWKPAKMTANADNTVFTITISASPKEHEFAILVCDATGDANWDNKLVANAPAYGGAANAKVTIPTTGGEVVLFEGIDLVAPAA